MTSNKGFTLVELSIVLVIIGLLIGGILVAQSMIGTTKINSFVSQIQQYDAAISNFKSKYKCLPGDSNFDGLGGNCDGFIYDNSNNDDYFRNEMANFWYHLGLTELNKEKYSNIISPGVTAGVHIPKAIIGTKSGIIASTSVAEGVLNGYTHAGKNVYTIGYFNTATARLENNSTAKESIAVIDAVAVDKKMDDGAANAGKVQTIGNHSSSSNIGLEPGRRPRAECSSGASYNMTSTYVNPCGLSIEMLSFTGQN